MTETASSVEEVPPEQKNKFQVSSILVFGFIFGLIGLLGWGLWQSNLDPVEAGKAPDFALTNFDGETIQLSELEGQVVVLNFWASWCIPCRDEAPYLEATWRKYKDQGVVFIGIDYVDTESEALAYLEEFDITYFNGPDLGTRISRDYRTQGIPETFYIGKNGEIRGVQIGPLFAPKLDVKIEELLAETYP